MGSCPTQVRPWCPAAYAPRACGQHRPCRTLKIPPTVVPTDSVAGREAPRGAYGPACEKLQERPRRPPKQLLKPSDSTHRGQAADRVGLPTRILQFRPGFDSRLPRVLVRGDLHGVASRACDGRGATIADSTDVGA